MPRQPVRWIEPDDAESEGFVPERRPRQPAHSALRAESAHQRPDQTLHLTPLSGSTGKIRIRFHITRPRRTASIRCQGDGVGNPAWCRAAPGRAGVREPSARTRRARPTLLAHHRVPAVVAAVGLVPDPVLRPGPPELRARFGQRSARTPPRPTAVPAPPRPARPRETRRGAPVPDARSGPPGYPAGPPRPPRQRPHPRPGRLVFCTEGSVEQHPRDQDRPRARRTEPRCAREPPHPKNDWNCPLRTIVLAPRGAQLLRSQAVGPHSTDRTGFGPTPGPTGAHRPKTRRWISRR